MKNATDLATALNQAATQTPSDAPIQTTPHTPARLGKKMIGGHFDPTVHRRLKQLALDRDCTIQDLLGEAIDLLMTASGMPPMTNLHTNE